MIRTHINRILIKKSEADHSQPIDYLHASDEELMLAYQKGDTKSFDSLFRRHQNGIYNFIARFLGRSDNAEEVFQEVFFRIVRSAKLYQPSAKFSTWAYTIARNNCIDAIRRQKVRQIVSFSSPDQDSEGVGEFQFVDKQTNVERQVSAQHLTQKLEQALQLINPDQREVFLLREKSGLSFDEIAQVVDSSVNTVKSRMRYAISGLKAELEKMGVTEL